MADSDCIIVHEQVVVPDAVAVEEIVALPGEKGDKGDPFTYDDFTPEQIAELQRPATEAAAVANQAAEKANKAVTDIKVLGVTLTAEEAKRESAESSRASAESERAEAEFQRETSFSQMQTTLEGLITDTRTATSNANTAAGNAENAATEANNSATLANAAADKANQAAQNVDGRVTSLEEKASQVYENLAAIEASGETNPNKIYIDGETMQPYIYKGSFVPFKQEYSINILSGFTVFKIDWGGRGNKTHQIYASYMYNGYIYSQKLSNTLSGGIQKSDIYGNVINIDDNDWRSKSPFTSIFVVKNGYIFGIRENNSIVKIDDITFETVAKYSRQFSDRFAIYIHGDKIVVYDSDSIYTLDESTLDLTKIDTVENILYVYIVPNGLLVVTPTTMYLLGENFAILQQRDLPENFNGDNIKWVCVKPAQSKNYGITILNKSNKITQEFFTYSNPSVNGFDISQYIQIKSRIYDISEMVNVFSYDIGYYLTDLGYLVITKGSVGNIYGIQKVVEFPYQNIYSNVGGNSERIYFVCSFANSIVL